LVGSVLVAPVLLIMPFLNRYSQGGRLQADREAARIVGRDSMLRSLARVRDLGQELNLRRRFWGYGFAPSLDQRIAKLQRET
jgi:Zn-dependent protease with chaperone function